MVHAKREEIITALKANHIEVRPLIAGNMANKPFWKMKYGDRNDFFFNCNEIDVHGFYLPNHQGLSREDIEFICSIIIKHTKS
jgi:dTDP-4-amino-4,6-dideoxygalactose transaminase